MAFISYVREDQEKVMAIAKQINNSGVITRLDEDMILPGDNWQLKIEQAIEKTDYFLLFFSCKATNHIGHYNREIEHALYEQSQHPIGKRFIIPIQLDECDMPHNLKKFIWLKTADKNFYKKLLMAIAPSRIQQTLQ